MSNVNTTSPNNWLSRTLAPIVRHRSLIAFWALVVALAAFNAYGAQRAYLGLAGLVMALVVIVAEYLAATLALDAERAWRNGEKVRAFVCGGLALFVFAPINVWGAHRAMIEAYAPVLDQQRQTAQDGIDKERAELQGQIAALDARIAAQEARLDAIPADIYGSRQEIRQAPILARMAELTKERASLVASLNAGELVAKAPQMPIDDRLIWIGGVMLEAAKVLGVWASVVSLAVASLVAPAAPQPQRNAASELASKLWEKRRRQQQAEAERDLLELPGFLHPRTA